MNKRLILIASMAFIMAGCGDKDEAVTGDVEPSAIEKAMDATSDTMHDAGSAMSEAASDAAEATKEATADAVDATKEMASDAYDAGKEVVHDAAQSVADATADEAAADAAAEAADVADAAAGVAEEGVATSSLARRRRGFREAEGGSDKGEGDLRETHRCSQVISIAMVV